MAKAIYRRIHLIEDLFTVSVRLSMIMAEIVVAGSQADRHALPSTDLPREASYVDRTTMEEVEENGC